MRFRLFQFAKQKEISVIFVSGGNIEKNIEAEFMELFEKHQMHLLMSPASFDIEGIKGVLQTTSLMIEHMAVMHTYSGSVIYGDSEKCTAERIYLELFPQHDIDMIAEALTMELEHFLKDLFLKKGKSKNNQYN